MRKALEGIRNTSQQKPLNPNSKTMSLIRYQFPRVPSRPSFERFPSLRDELDRLFDFALPTRHDGHFGGLSLIHI